MDDQSPLDTARKGFFHRFSSARRRELADALLAELDRQEAKSTEIRRSWAAARASHRGRPDRR